MPLFKGHWQPLSFLWDPAGVWKLATETDCPGILTVQNANSHHTEVEQVPPEQGRVTLTRCHNCHVWFLG